MDATSDLTPFERAALAALLAGDHPLLAALREQLAACRVSKRTFTGVGFFTDLILPTDTPSLPVRRTRIVLNDVAATWDGLVHGAGLILFIDGGRLTQLEGFTYDDPWPAEIENWRIYPQEVRRLGGVETSLQQLEAAWGSADERAHGSPDIQ